MASPTLFPLDEPVVPTTSAPMLWLKHLVILSRPDPSAVIRNISFRRGLNIIQTRQPIPNDNRVAGHSVGKTLLVRFIRYTLGEATFGSDETQRALRQVFPTASVIAHWCVGGNDWIVWRSLHGGRNTKHVAVQSPDWNDVFQEGVSKDSIEAFHQAVLETVLADLPPYQLTRGRPPQWLDVLAWLARDYQCGYRQCNDWRHVDSNTGSSLNRDENSLILQWLLGVMTDVETRLREAHDGKRREVNNIKRKLAMEEQRLGFLKDNLGQKFGEATESDNPDEPDELGTVDFERDAKTKIESLERLRADERGKSNIEELEARYYNVRDRVTREKANKQSFEDKIEQKQLEIAQHKIRKRPYNTGTPYDLCEGKPCWLKVRFKKSPTDDPAANHHIEELNGEINDLKKKVDECIESISTLEPELDDANADMKAERARLENVLAGINANIGRWQSYLDDANAYRDLARARIKRTTQLRTANNNVQESLKLIDATRKQQETTKNRLSAIYRQILCQIFDETVEGHIQVDGHGLRPIADQVLAPNGAAISVMTSVLAFDMSCVAASIEGVGHHPRFMIHDSPREGDMEGPLFSKLFDAAGSLEELFSNPEDMSFQYIVTTTTPPPEPFASEDARYVRLTLDARTDEGLLMMQAF